MIADEQRRVSRPGPPGLVRAGPGRVRPPSGTCCVGESLNRVSGLAELIRIVILQGGIAPGELLIEVMLAERFHTSQSTLREALRLLEGRGLLVANESGGMRVVELGPDELADTRV